MVSQCFGLAWDDIVIIGMGFWWKGSVICARDAVYALAARRSRVGSQSWIFGYFHSFEQLFGEVAPAWLYLAEFLSSTFSTKVAKLAVMTEIVLQICPRTIEVVNHNSGSHMLCRVNQSDARI